MHIISHMRKRVNFKSPNLPLFLAIFRSMKILQKMREKSKNVIFYIKE